MAEHRAAVQRPAHLRPAEPRGVQAGSGWVQGHGAAEGAPAATGPELDLGRAVAESARHRAAGEPLTPARVPVGERGAERARAERTAMAELQAGLALGRGRAAQAASQALALAALGQPQPRRIAPVDLPDGALSGARRTRCRQRPGGPAALPARRSGQTQRRGDRVEHERAQQHVVDDGHGQHMPDRGPGHPRIAEHGAEQGGQCLPDDGPGRGDHDLEQRRAPLLGYPFAVRHVGGQAARVADQAEHQGVLADEVAARRGDVKRQAGPEPDQHAGHRTARQAQRGHREQHYVGASPAREGDPVDDGELDDDRNADDHEGYEPAYHQPPPPVADGVAEGPPADDGRTPGAREPEDDGLGVTVIVTVGAGRGRIEVLGLCLGTWTTTPTTPRAVKSTNGRTSAVWVSDPGLEWTETTVPTGTPGTSGWSPTEA